MTGPRPVIDTNLERERLRPATSPRDTFVRPGDGRNLAQLAQALEGFGGELSRLNDVRARRNEAFEAAQGTASAADAARQGITSFREAREAGLIREDEDPFFTRAAKEQFGRVLGDRFSSNLVARLNQDDIKDADDLAIFDEVFDEFQQQFSQDNGVELEDSAAFRIAFGETVQQTRARARQAFAGRVSDNLGITVFQQTQQEGFGILKNRLQQGADPAAIAAELTELKDFQRELGMSTNRKVNPLTINRALIASIVNYAEQTGDTSVYAIADLIKTGPGGNLGSTNEALTAFNDSRAKVSQRNRAADNHAFVVEEREEAEALESLLVSGQTAVVDAFLKGDVTKANGVIEDVIETLGRLPRGAAAVQTLEKFRTTLMGRDFENNTATEQSLINDVFTITNPEDDDFVNTKRLMDSFGPGGLNTQGLSRVQSFLSAFRESGGKALDRQRQDFNSQTINRYRTTLRRRITPPPSPLDAILDPGIRERREQLAEDALTDFNIRIVEYIKTNGLGDLTAFETFANGLNDFLFNKYPTASAVTTALNAGLAGAPPGAVPGFGTAADFRNEKLLSETQISSLVDDLFDSSSGFTPASRQMLIFAGFSTGVEAVDFIVAQAALFGIETGIQ